MANVIVLFAAISCFSWVYCFPTSRDSCREPDNLEKQLSEHNSDDYIKYILPPNLRVLMDIQEHKRTDIPPPEHDTTKHSPPEQIIYGNKTCPNKLPSGVNAALPDRSMCPFYYVMSYNPSRYPTAIAVARCKCTDCIGGDIFKVCEPFHQPVKILRKIGCENGRYVYIPEITEIVAGCMCAEKLMVVPQPPTNKEADSHGANSTISGTESPLESSTELSPSLVKR